jgi:glycosyltransferase involved in cell wall biosynthesis
MANNNGKVKVAFFHRKARAVGNYSVEFIFEDVRNRLAAEVDATAAYSKYESQGLFKRLYNCVEAMRRQRQVNHVTGDINYLGLLLKKRKTIHTILDCVFLEASSGIKRKVLKYFWLTMPVRKSMFVTAISASTRNEILKHVRCSPDKVKVIPVAISERFVRKDKPFNESKPVILQLGAAHNKNIPRLIEALKGISCELHIVGKQNDEYEQLLKANQIDYQYQWGLTDGEVLRKYEAADIITLASTYEGFGMPILEAQAVGRPVITANLFSMPEVAGDAACMVDPYKPEEIRAAVLKIINDPAYRESLVQKGFENVKRYNPEVIARQYLELYKAVAGR